MLVVFSSCIISLGYAVGDNIDQSLQEHLKYLDLCSNGLDDIESIDDIVFCHQYDISMRITK